MKSAFYILSTLLLSILNIESVCAQDLVPFSEHMEQNNYFEQRSKQEIHTIFNPVEANAVSFRGKCKLNRVVFGFHPYWEEGAEVNYKWNLLSDFCYFNYDVNPSTGLPTTIHDWLTAPSVDAALAQGKRVHLAMTLFGNHAQFFNNKTAQQAFSDKIISLLKARKGIGVNLDIEAVPKTLKKKLTAFVLFFGKELHREIPGSILSIDIPAVDWSGTFEISKMNKVVDLYFIMGYGYYYSGSSESGPSAPLYSLVDYYDYSLSRTISYYQTVEMPLEKMVLGLPFYGKAWKVSKSGAPAKTLSKGTNVFYRDVAKNTNGYYSKSNRRWASTSFSNFYVYKKAGAWYHAFVLDAKEYKSQLNIIRQRGLAGTGMWALGYDDGSSALWDVIRETMTDCYALGCKGTLYDSGGPYGNYFNSEDYGVLLNPSDKGTLRLKFSYFSTENQGDYLSIFDGSNATAPLIGQYSTASNIPEITSTGPALYLKFHSDNSGRKKGYKAYWTCDTSMVHTNNLITEDKVRYRVRPNPSSGLIRLDLYGMEAGKYSIEWIDAFGQKVGRDHIDIYEGRSPVVIDLSGYERGIYFFRILSENGIVQVSGSCIRE